MLFRSLNQYKTLQYHKKDLQQRDIQMKMICNYWQGIVLMIHHMFQQHHKTKLLLYK